jgi:transcriptional regulator with XRE-family HTH domain
MPAKLVPAKPKSSASSPQTSRAKIRSSGRAAGEGLRLGPRLKQVRLLKGLTLRQLADAAACSESLLSKIENGRNNPSVTTLHKIAAALGTTIAGLTPGRDEHERIVSLPTDRPSYATDDDSIRIERLISASGINLLQGYIHWIKPGGGYEGEVITHQGEELGYILEGEVELFVDGRTYTLGVGASFHFRSELPHGYRNSGKVMARIIWVSTPPTF